MATQRPELAEEQAGGNTTYVEIEASEADLKRSARTLLGGFGALRDELTIYTPPPPVLYSPRACSHWRWARSVEGRA